MPTRKCRIGRVEIAAMAAGSELLDAGKGAITGFTAKRGSGELVSYYLRYRNPAGRSAWLKLGRSDAMKPDDAREQARLALRVVQDGRDPQAEKRDRKRAPTIADLCREYLAAAEKGQIITRRGVKRASTLLSDRGRVERHIIPLLGAEKVADLTSAHIRRMMRAIAAGQTAQRVPTGTARGLSNVRGGQGVASRTVGLLGGILTYAIAEGLRAEPNPVRGVIRPPDRVRDRRLSDDEFAALGAALGRADEPKRAWPAAVAVTRFLAVTGWRSGEALGLRWRDLDLARRAATLETKTGKSVRPLARAALDIIRTVPRTVASDLVFPSATGGLMTGYRSMFDRMLRDALPSDFHPHVLRHSVASVAADLGRSELTIAILLGHRAHSVTSRYAHMLDTAVLAAADQVADEILTRMGAAGISGRVIELRPAG